MMGQLLRSVFTTVWGEEIKTPGLIENRDAEAMNQQHLFDLILTLLHPKGMNRDKSEAKRCCLHCALSQPILLKNILFRYFAIIRDNT